MRLILKPFTLLARLSAGILRGGLRLAAFSAIAAALMLAVDLLLLRDREHPER